MQTYAQCFAVHAEEPVFTGHFPGRPILPGVLLLAMVRQTLMAAEGRPFRLHSISRQKFIRPVIPATNVTVECRVKERQGALLKLACRFLLPDGQPAATAELCLEVQ